MLGGAVACFAGHRLFRLVLGIYGFIIGAMFASSMAGVNSQMAMVIAAVVGGLAGSLILVMAYFIGIALIGAGLGALIGHSVWGWFAAGDPPVIAVVVVSVAGALAAMVLQRYVIVVGTALAGAWTMIVGIVNALAARGVTRGASASEVWILYPTSVGDATWAPYFLCCSRLAGSPFSSAARRGKRRK